MNVFFQFVLKNYDPREFIRLSAKFGIGFALSGILFFAAGLLFYPYLQLNSACALFVIPMATMVISIFLYRQKLPLLFVLHYTIASSWVLLCTCY
jgi:hypothetical protein